MNKRFNLETIHSSLRSFQEGFDEINAKLSLHREPFDDVMIQNILAAYAFLNQQLKRDIDLFSLAGLHSLLELNYIILCGTELQTRFEFHSHINETRDVFHKGIKKLRKWVNANRKAAKPHKLASVFYSLALSQPQLFLEGNHRTENIIVNYLLVSAGADPYIIDGDSAFEYLELSSNIKFLDKNSFAQGKINLKGLGKEFAKFLKKHGNHNHLVN